ncbi:alpha/beta hydrolase family protein [Tenacibaculum sp. 190524A02b]|uniref:alpha/beta hydrolase family protein n=1 Tax=Tenacibaculum vairaonense TaxID=3137860 RepID=UPI0031FB5475
MKKLNFLSIPLTLFIFICTSFVACKNYDLKQNSITPDNNSGYLIEASFLGEYSLAEIQASFTKNVDYSSDIANKLKYGVKVYKIIYSTNYVRSGFKIKASGAVLIPNTSETMDMLSYQHETLEVSNYPPSNFLNSAPLYVSPTVFASIGYISVLPDYIGYGSSEIFEHPYEHGESLATASRDMIRATREFIALKDDSNLSDKLFLTGYSEGASATMALHRLLQNKHSDEFTVTATSCGAGAYDKKAFMEFTMDTNKELKYLNFYLWVIDCYNDIYNINLNYNDIYKKPYADVIKNEGVFTDLNSTNPQKVFNKDFVNDIKNGTATKMIAAMKDNSYYDFMPEAPVLLVHGKVDNFVPFYNAQKAYDKMTSKGANIKLIGIEDGDHSNITPQYNNATIGFFEQFKSKNLKK